MPEVVEAWQSSDQEMSGTVTLVYDRHVYMLTEKLTELQHKYSAILPSMHVPLDHDNCLEVVLVRGKVSTVQKPANGLIAIKEESTGSLRPLCREKICRDNVNVQSLRCTSPMDI